MAEEVEVCYAEITELSTFSKHTSQVLLIPTRSTEEDAALGTYLTMDEFRKRESSPDVPNCAKPPISRSHLQNGPVTYKKAIEIEDVSCLQYENVSVSSTASKKSNTQQTDSVRSQGLIERGIPQNLLMTTEKEYIDCIYNEAVTEPSTSLDEKHDTTYEQHLSTSFINPQTESNLTMCKRLEISRRTMRSFEFICYAMGAVYREAEQNTIVDAISSFFSLGVLVIDGCKVCNQIPVIMVCSGIMDSVANVISVGIILKNDSRKYLWWRDTTRGIRAIMLAVHIYGLVLTYEVFRPEETDKSNARYCNTYLYWLGFAYFHTFIFTSVATVIVMISFSLFYLFTKNKYVFR